METAKLLKIKKDEILANWLNKVLTQIPEAGNYDKTAIQNSVPDLINAIVDVLKSNNTNAVISYSEQHGLERAKYKAYSLKHIIQEYNLLKGEIFKILDENTAVTERKDRDIIMNSIDYAIEQAAEVFFREKQNVQVKARKVAERKADQLQIEDEHREEFIQSIMHDLNSPLNNIKACISMLEGNIEVSEASKILEILKLSSQQAEILIEDFLDVGFVKSDDKIPVQKNIVNVLEDLKQQIKIYKISYKRNIELNSPHKEINVNVDVNLIRRAFNNLMNNALKHGETSKTIKVVCKLENGELIISVQNQGRTIPRETLEAIFKRYYKMNESSKGWGIGLAFVKKVAEAHGGEVTVKSIQPEGNTFILKIPTHDN
jgi:signal transduction histidine kinase